MVLFNKALNDMVHASRARSGMAPLADEPGVGTPRASGVRRLRSRGRGGAARAPFHRAYHSVELSMLAVLAAFGDLLLGGGLLVTRGLVVGLLVAAIVTVVGHTAAILTSSKLR